MQPQPLFLLSTAPSYDYTWNIVARSLKICHKTILLKLEKIQYEANRTALGLMRSIQVNLVLSEGRECLFGEGRLLLAKRNIAKVFSYENTNRNLLREVT